MKLVKLSRPFFSPTHPRALESCAWGSCALTSWVGVPTWPESTVPSAINPPADRNARYGDLHLVRCQPSHGHQFIARYSQEADMVFCSHVNSLQSYSR